MKSIRIALILSCLTFAFGSPSDVGAQTTSFTYQGRLSDTNGPVTGIQDFEFRLFNAAADGQQQGPTVTFNDLSVTNGLFVTALDFGGNFPGADRYLQISVRPGASTGAYVTLSPRQPITSAPYAVKALEAAGLPSGAVSATMLGSGAVTGAKLGSGAVTTDKIADGTITVGDINLTSFNASFWSTSGNAGISNSTQFLGTKDNQPIEIRANNRRALRLEPTADGANVIGGSSNNAVGVGVVGAVIAGGGASGGSPNRVEADHASILGGLGNSATGTQSVIGGGRGNTAGGTRAVVGGGLFNQALGFASVVVGGNANAATNNWSTIGGGADNLASGYASVIPGGINNTASANFTTAMGYRAKSQHNGAFVYADLQETDFNSTATNQFNVRASGGVRLETSGAGLTVDGRSPLLAPAFGEPMVLSVNGAPALRIEPTGQAPNVIGGYSENSAGPQVVGATVFGGGENFGQFPNKATAEFATALGGLGNTASGPASLATGEQSVASGHSSTAMGFQPIASGGSSFAIGYRTRATGFASTSMGSESVATNNDATAMGRLTLAGGSASTAMGYRAQALHHGSFVWADQQNEDFSSTSTNQFCLRASGGVRLAEDTSLGFGERARQMINLWGVQYGIGVQTDAAYFRSDNEFLWFRGGGHSDKFADAGGGELVMRLGSTGNLILAGTLSQGSDRHIKQGFTTVDPQAVLDKVAALPIQTWTYTNDVSRRHIGPVAQDFHAAFGLNGTDDTHIATVDADGVALAAIQGLNQKLEQAQRENSSLKERVEMLEKLVRTLVTK